MAGMENFMIQMCAMGLSSFSICLMALRCGLKVRDSYGAVFDNQIVSK